MSPPPSIHSIQSIFRAVDLPLCDDQRAVEEAGDRLRSTRNRELNSTKGTVAAKAQAWFDDVDTLLNRREPLLEAAYEHFSQLAGSVLAAANGAERRRLARRARRALLPLATDWCGAREDLAQQWIKRFAAERKLNLAESEDEAPAEQPERRGRTTSRGRKRGGRASGTAAPAPAKPSLPGRRLALAVAGALVLALALGGASLEGGFAQLWDAAEASALSLTHGDQPATPANTTSGEPALPTASEPVVAEASPQETDEPSAETAEPLEPVVPAEPWRLGLHAPPAQAFAGQMLVLRLDCERRPLDAEPLELALHGLVFKGFDVNGQPPALRLAVKALPEGASEGEATWSVRLLDRDGGTSTLLTGGCKVVPAD